jgi:hypothetical protein
LIEWNRNYSIHIKTGSALFAFWFIGLFLTKKRTVHILIRQIWIYTIWSKRFKPCIYRTFWRDPKWPWVQFRFSLTPSASRRKILVDVKYLTLIFNQLFFQNPGY